VALLEVTDLTVTLQGAARPAPLVEDVSFSIDRGETFCIVGESGSGKTVTAQSIIRLLEYVAPVETTGRIVFDGVDLAGVGRNTLAGLRGRRIAMIFQECMEALNPTRRVGAQLEEVWDYHRDWRGQSASGSARERAIQVLRDVEMPDPEGCLERYPHQLSGGMQQRAMIAMAMMCEPDLLIADEPTTALDVTIQAEILRKLRLLQRDRGMALLLITHDMGIAAELADRIGVMYAGKLAEIGPAASLLTAPRHPYTSGLLACVPRSGQRQDGPMPTIPGNVPGPEARPAGCRFAPRCGQATDQCRSAEPPLAAPDGNGSTHPFACWHPVPLPAPGAASRLPVVPAAGPASARPDDGDVLVRLADVTKIYARRARARLSARAAASLETDGNAVVAVDHVSLDLRRGELFGLVGETGSGKSTLGRMIGKLEDPTGGSIVFDGTDLSRLRRPRPEKAFRRQVQMIFQDPYGSIDPRFTVERVIAEPLRALQHDPSSVVQERTRRLLDEVGLSHSLVGKRVDELSGGQRQRVAIARAMAVGPKLIIADEPTSALDVSVQGQVMNVLLGLQRELGLTYLFISHNLNLVLSVADRVGVMYLGAMVEVASAVTLAAGPAHPYTAALLSANPDLDSPKDGFGAAAGLGATGTAPAPADRRGCRFRHRCPRAAERCRVEAPPLRPEAPLLRPDGAGRQVACHFPLAGFGDAGEPSPGGSPPAEQGLARVQLADANGAVPADHETPRSQP